MVQEVLLISQILFTWLTMFSREVQDQLNLMYAVYSKNQRGDC